jgi:hypothetical protein
VKLPEQCAMPVVEIVDGRENDETPVIAIFYGPLAYIRAVAVIGSLPDYKEGRWGLDICDVECSGCGDLFWHEAWNVIDPGHVGCPSCHRVFMTEDADTMTTSIPELES